MAEDLVDASDRREFAHVAPDQPAGELWAVPTTAAPPDPVFPLEFHIFPCLRLLLGKVFWQRSLVFRREMRRPARMREQERPLPMGQVQLCPRIGPNVP